MNRSFFWGSVAMMVGLFLLVMKGLARLMPGDPERFNYSLNVLLDPDRLTWIETISSSGLQSAVTWMVGAPLYLYCFGVGLLLILLSGLKKD
ncbi:hypothetical protein [Desulfoluna sp.]|uniref:hypothetical protein n=1 Tax=Desulfoluna sp. TaxID=2045199 RepID=UPI002608CD25|nr:hypothetical protein [Desulfoluna sp.]